MHGAPCPMSAGIEKTWEEVIQDLIDRPPANPQEFLAKIEESGYKIVPKGLHKKEKAHSFLPPQPKMVIIRLDAAKNALKDHSDE